MPGLIHQRSLKGPATHAIVIAVGEYPHLPGGKAKVKFANAHGMRQLTSPPHSGRAIARWLLEEYRHPSKPLASLSLLISDPAGADFTYNSDGKSKTVACAPANMMDVESAVKEWRALGNSDPEHLLLFFFCGHGIACEPYLALLLSDFGAESEAPLAGALDFRRFRQNMIECAAREQCYFIDACRVGLPLMDENDGFAGNPIVHRTGGSSLSGRVRQAPVLYSTLAGEQAYSRPGKPSIFTSALIETFSGAGSGDEEGPWRVRTNLVHDALGFLIRDASQRHKLASLQIPSAEDLSNIALNEIAAPKVSVVITCAPEEVNSRATLLCRNATLSMRRRPAKTPWRLQLPVGIYDVAARVKTKEFPKQGCIVRPPFRHVRLDTEL